MSTVQEHLRKAAQALQELSRKDDGYDPVHEALRELIAACGHGLMRWELTETGRPLDPQHSHKALEEGK